MRYIQGTDRNQIILPQSIEEMVSEDNPVRVIDAFVDMLDMEQLGFKKSTPAVTGRLAYNPSTLLKLYLYGYFFSIRSSRKLMRECKRNIELIFLLNGLSPDFRTISDFRKENAKSIRSTFSEFTQFCMFLKLYDCSEAIAIDGSKFRAVNANKKMYNREILNKKCKRIEEKLDQYLRELEEQDRKDAKQEPFLCDDPRDLQEKITTLKERKALYEQWKQELSQSGEKQKLVTDPQARMMHTTKDGYHCCYNVQTAVSARSMLVIDYKVTNHVNDQGIMHSFSQQIKQNTNQDVISLIADKGYDCKEEILACVENGVIADVGFKDAKDERIFPLSYQPCSISEKLRHSTKPQDIKKCLHAGVLPACYEQSNISLEVHPIGRIGAFLRGSDLSYVTCPMGYRLNKVKQRRGGMVYKSNLACRQCTNRCTSSRYPKEVFFADSSSCVAARMYGKGDALNTPPAQFTPTNSFFKKNQVKKNIILKIANDPQKQRQRLCISEHPFGTVKWHHGAHYVLCKGIEKTTAELGLSFLAYNLKRAINMVGTKALIQAMRGV